MGQETLEFKIFSWNQPLKPETLRSENRAVLNTCRGFQSNNLEFKPWSWKQKRICTTFSCDFRVLPIKSRYLSRRSNGLHANQSPPSHESLRRQVLWTLDLLCNAYPPATSKKQIRTESKYWTFWTSVCALFDNYFFCWSNHMMNWKLKSSCTGRSRALTPCNQNFGIYRKPARVAATFHALVGPPNFDHVTWPNFSFWLWPSLPLGSDASNRLTT